MDIKNYNVLNNDAALKEAMDAIDVFMMDEENRLAYINRQMALLDYENDHIYDVEKAMEQGIEQGIEQGADMVNKLNEFLVAEGRTEDLLKTIADKEYQKQLLDEFAKRKS